MRASFRLRCGPVRLTVWPHSFPWLLEVGRRQRWLFDRGQNLAAPDDEDEPGCRHPDTPSG